MTALAATRDLVKRFGPVPAVSGVSLQVGAGEVVGMLGANGAGKTTLIRCLLGLIAPTSGEVELFGAQPVRSSLRRVGYLPQGLGLYTDLTVRENLSFRARVYGVAEDEPAAELSRHADVPVGALSLGVQRRVAFAASLAQRPELLVLDEPTSGVGPLGRARLWDTIRAAAEEGVGVLVTTHHIEEAEQCDRLVMLAAGRVVAAGSLENVIGGRRVVDVASDDLPGALAALDQARIPAALAGRRLRVVGASAPTVERALGQAGVGAKVEEKAATLEEVFVALASS